MLIDAVQSVAKFVKITEAKMHDKNFLKDIQVPPFSMLVFDKAYNYYKQFAQWTAGDIYFVTRQKNNALYEIEKTVMEKELEKDKAGVSKEEIITIAYKEDKQEKKFHLRRIHYRDEKNRQYVCIHLQ